MYRKYLNEVFHGILVYDCCLLVQQYANDDDIFKWINDEVLYIYDLEKSTNVLLGHLEKKLVPRMVKYIKEINKENLTIIQKWLKLKHLKYFAISDTDSFENCNVVSTWYEEIDNDQDLQEIYKLIFMNLSGTIHALNFNVGDFSERWLENHREYHSWNSCLPGRYNL